MDQHRQIRFVIPPFFLLASLLWGAFLGGMDLSSLLKPETARQLLGLIAATAVALLPLGFLISTVSISLIRLLARVRGWRTYEAVVTPEAYARIWRNVVGNGQADATQTLYAVATFDHELLRPGIHTWIMRRWNAFNVSAHSAVALLLAHAIAPWLGVPQTWEWWVWTVVLTALLVTAAIVAWRETMRMIQFQAERRSTGPGQDTQ